jgi:hypothetical protein
LSYRSLLGAVQLQVLDFGSKLYRGVAVLEEQVDMALRADLVMQAETFYMRPAFKAAGILDVEDLKAHLTEEGKEATALANPSPAPAAEVSSPPGESARAAEEPESGELVHLAGLEDFTQADRFHHFSHISVPELVRDVLMKNPDDSQYEDLVEDGIKILRTHLVLAVEPAGSELAVALSNNGCTADDDKSKIYLYDVGRRYGRSADENPYKQPLRLDTPHFNHVAKAGHVSSEFDIVDGLGPATLAVWNFMNSGLGCLVPVLPRRLHP